MITDIIWIKPKPQLTGKRFHRHHVDGICQGNTFQFCIRGVTKVYVTSFTDDCTRIRVKSQVQRRFFSGQCPLMGLCKVRIPRVIYLNNGKQFVS